MTIQNVLLLGNPRLYEISEPVGADECEALAPVVADLHDTLMAFREKHGAGRAVAAPQIGVMKRLIYMHIDGISAVLFNPVMDQKSSEMMTVWDDCMSFPSLLVKVKRHKSCRVRYRDRNWKIREVMFEDDLSELIQHEYDHLDGILAVSRAIDGQSFAIKGQEVGQAPV